MSLPYTSNMKEAVEEKAIPDVWPGCDLGPVWIKSKISVGWTQNNSHLFTIKYIQELTFKILFQRLDRKQNLINA